MVSLEEEGGEPAIGITSSAELVTFGDDFANSGARPVAVETVSFLELASG